MLDQSIVLQTPWLSQGLLCRDFGSGSPYPRLGRLGLLRSPGYRHSLTIQIGLPYPRGHTGIGWGLLVRSRTDLLRGCVLLIHGSSNLRLWGSQWITGSLLRGSERMRLLPSFILNCCVYLTQRKCVTNLVTTIEVTLELQIKVCWA